MMTMSNEEGYQELLTHLPIRMRVTLKTAQKVLNTPPNYNRLPVVPFKYHVGSKSILEIKVLE